MALFGIAISAVLLSNRRLVNSKKTVVEQDSINADRIVDVEALPRTSELK